MSISVVLGRFWSWPSDRGVPARYRTRQRAIGRADDLAILFRGSGPRRRVDMSRAPGVKGPAALRASSVRVTLNSAWEEGPLPSANAARRIPWPQPWSMPAFTVEIVLTTAYGWHETRVSGYACGPFGRAPMDHDRTNRITRIE
jgi:hypothetical protein